jgi:hypothetical protein
MVRGWGGQNLLASYETERMPIALRNTDAARRLAANINETDIDPAIEDATPAGDAARQKAAAMLSTFGEQFASIGVQLGARYDGSPLIVEDGAPPPDSLTTYIPTTIPGGRTPHAWLDATHGRGASLHDRLGSGFALLRLGSGAPDASAFAVAAGRRGVPLRVLDVADQDVRELYDRDLVLVRPDQHVAWRGNNIPTDCDRLLARVVGGE